MRTRISVAQAQDRLRREISSLDVPVRDLIEEGRRAGTLGAQSGYSGFMEETRPRADFVIEAPDRGIQLVVEAKNTIAPTRDWLQRFLRNLFVHAAIPRSEYFLLALRDHLYLWRKPDPDRQAPPDFEGDTAAILAPYLRTIPNRLDTLSERGFELLVYAWLSDLVAGATPQPEAAKWLEDSGLIDSIRDGTIKSQMAA